MLNYFNNTKCINNLNIKMSQCFANIAQLPVIKFYNEKLSLVTLPKSVALHKIHRGNTLFMDS